MEHLWRRADANGGTPPQMRRLRKRLGQAKSVAVDAVSCTHKQVLRSGSIGEPALICAPSRARAALRRNQWSISERATNFKPARSRLLPCSISALGRLRAERDLLAHRLLLTVWRTQICCRARANTRPCVAKRQVTPSSDVKRLMIPSRESGAFA